MLTNGQTQNMFIRLKSKAKPNYIVRNSFHFNKFKRLPIFRIKSNKLFFFSADQYKHIYGYYDNCCHDNDLK